MKITKTKLKQIIKEEVVKLLVEQDEYDDYDDYNDYEEEELTPAQKIIKLLSSTDPDNVNLGLGILDALENPQPGVSQLEYQRLKLEYQQLINTIASHFTFDSKSSLITIQGFEVSNVTFWMILNYFAEKSSRVQYMLAKIESLNIKDKFMTNVDFLKFCTNLTSLELWGCESLQNVDGLKGCTNLTTLNLWECDSLQNVDGLEGCTNLTYLYLYWCESLQNVDGLKECINLETLKLNWCKSLQNVDVLKECTNLTTLDLRRCASLPLGLQDLFKSDEYDTAHEQFMKALNASKGN